MLPTASQRGKSQVQGGKTGLVLNHGVMHTQITNGITKLFLPTLNHPPPRIWETNWD